MEPIKVIELFSGVGSQSIALSNLGIPHKVIGILRIRYLTPNECFRLMGFSDEQFNKIRLVVPAKTNQYKLAGNTIVISVLEQIFKSIYIDESFDKARPQQTNLDVCFSNEKVGGDVEKNKS